MYIQYLVNLKELVVEAVSLFALGKALAKLLVLTRKDGLLCGSKVD